MEPSCLLPKVIHFDKHLNFQEHLVISLTAWKPKHTFAQGKPHRFIESGINYILSRKDSYEFWKSFNLASRLGLTNRCRQLILEHTFGERRRHDWPRLQGSNRIPLGPWAVAVNAIMWYSFHCADGKLTFLSPSFYISCHFPRGPRQNDQKEIEYLLANDASEDPPVCPPYLSTHRVVKQRLECREHKKKNIFFEMQGAGLRFRVRSLFYEYVTG